MAKEIIIMTALLLCGCFPAHKTPRELATWAKCKPDMIASWQSGRIQYKKQNGWQDAETVMSRGHGDCKAFAAISSEALEACGADSRVIILNKNHSLHAITTFTLQDGRRGFIDGGTSRTYPATTEWREIVADIPGGPWVAEYAGWGALWQ